MTMFDGTLNCCKGSVYTFISLLSFIGRYTENVNVSVSMTNFMIIGINSNSGGGGGGTISYLERSILFTDI